MPKKIPYGVMNYAEIINGSYYFIDKTKYISDLETVNNPVFLRPRRFGKSLLCSMLQYYYDKKEAGRFQTLFGQTWIGKNPTCTHNTFIVIKYDFSTIPISKNFPDIEHNFNRYCNELLISVQSAYKEILRDFQPVHQDGNASTNLSVWLDKLAISESIQVYVIIDEYDNFVNQLITTHQDHLYREITSGDSFLRTFFKVLKAGRQTGAISNVFITGVLPITIDDLTSSYNIGKFITLSPTFEHMLGFTQEEVNQLLTRIFQDHNLPSDSRDQVEEIIKNQYNGYTFVNPEGEKLYNPTMLMYFLDLLCEQQKIPIDLIDLNLRTDLSWVKRITGSNPKTTGEFVHELTVQDTIQYNRNLLVSKFNMNQFFERNFYPISFFYLGMLTKKDEFRLQLPNLSMRAIMVEYFNEMNHVDITTDYGAVQEEFGRNPDLHMLFSRYWELYIKRLPEAIFSQVNENFYRTTFYSFCSQILFSWFTWNIERSYIQGRTDLEFVGKYHERFAGLRWVIEFKYISNTEWKKHKIPIESWNLQEQDRSQILAYAGNLKQEYPQTRIHVFIVYCIGNIGYRIFEISVVI